MVQEIEASELRKSTGIKRLKKKITIPETEKSAIKMMRQGEKRRISHAERLKA